MSRLFGTALLVAGSLPPLAALLAFTLWAQYTVGIDIDASAWAWLGGIAVVDLLCLGIGVHLVRRPRRTQG